jgi:phosphopantetheinyl transferase
LAAKDAVRRFIGEQFQLDLSPADIEIVEDEFGRPCLRPELLEELDCNLAISISHSAGKGVAVVGQLNDHVGVGIEIEGRDRTGSGSDWAALSNEERAVLSGVSEAQKGEWLIRLRCARRAVAKALGGGTVPEHLRIVDVQVESGDVTLTFVEPAVETLSPYANRYCVAKTGSDENTIFAVSVV